MEERKEQSPSSSLETSQKIPRIPLDVRAHKRVIFISTLPVLLGSCILPLTGYFALHYKSTLKTQTILSIFMPIFGVVSLFSLITRTIRLARPSSPCRPLGTTSPWALDYFDWNFAGGFVVISVIISIGISQVPSNVRIVSMPLSLLLLQVYGQIVLITPLRLMRMRVPFRISSLAKGESIRPACYTIIEDVVAVDAKQNDVFRAAWNARYEASPPFRQLLIRMDYLWGFSGTALGGGIIAIIYAVPNTSVGWAIGWSVPLLWAGLMALVSIQMTKSMCRQENQIAPTIKP